MNGGDPWVRTKDGIETPFLLRKRVPDVCQLSCGFMSSVRDALFLFYFIYGIYVANAFRTSVYGTLVRTTYDG